MKVSCNTVCKTNSDCVTDSVFNSDIEDQVDHVRAYFGMRKISLGRVGNEKALRPLLNDKFVFHMGMLDQVPCKTLSAFTWACWIM